MSAGILNGSFTTVERVPKGDFVLPIVSTAQLQDITINGNRFSLSDLGDHVIELLLNPASVNANNITRAQLFNFTQDSIVQQFAFQTPNDGQPDNWKILFDFSVTDIADEYELRLFTAGNGDPLNVFNLAPPVWRALIFTTNPNIVSNCASLVSSGQVQMATEAQTVEPTEQPGTNPTLGTSGCPLVASPRNLLVRRETAVGALYSVAYGSVPDGRGEYALDFQSYRKAVTKVASGQYASAVGVNNSAPNYQSQAFGYGNDATGENAVCAGVYNFGPKGGSVSIGILNGALGVSLDGSGHINTKFGTAYAFSPAYYGANVVMVGIANLAYTTGAVTMGTGNIASGTGLNPDPVAAMGFGNLVYASAVALGVNNYISGGAVDTTAVGVFSFVGLNAEGSTLVGDRNYCGDPFSTAVGYLNATYSTTGKATAVGYANDAYGNNAVALGRSNFSAAASSVSLGVCNNINVLTNINSTTGVIINDGQVVNVSGVGINSTTVGVGNQAVALRSFAGGFKNVISSAGIDSCALGSLNTVSSPNSVSIGVSNSIGIYSGLSVQIGDTTSIGNNSIRSIAAGYEASIGNLAENNIALGSYSEIDNDVQDSIAVGFESYVGDSADQSVAIGNYAEIAANANGGVAIGNHAEITYGSSNAIAVGTYAYNYGDRSTTIGYRSKTIGSDSLVVGRSNFTSFGSKTVVALGVCNNINVPGNINDTTGVISGGAQVLNLAGTGINSTTVGVGNQAVALRSFAGGFKCVVSSTDGSALGSSSSIGTGAERSSVFGYACAIGNGSYDSLAVGSYTTLGTGSYFSVAIGNQAVIGNASFKSVVLGYNSSIGDDGEYNTVLGAENNVATGYTHNTLVGNELYTNGGYNFVGGYNNSSTGDYQVMIGVGCSGGGDRSIALGYGAVCSANSSSAIGRGSNTTVEESTNIAGAIITKNTTLGGGTNATAFRSFAGAEIRVASDLIDFTSTGDITIVIPSGGRFYIDSIEIILTTLTVLVTEPFVRAGIVGTLAKYLAIVQTTLLNDVNNREKFEALAADQGESSAASLTFGVTTAAVADAMVGRVVLKGWFIADE
jgi:hypothetical protein